MSAVRAGPPLPSEASEPGYESDTFSWALAYATAVLFAGDTGLLEGEFPERCPYGLDDIMTRHLDPPEA